MDRASSPEEAVLAELISQWQHRRDANENVSAADLCRDHPALLALLQQRIDVLQRMEALVDGAETAESASLATSAPSLPAELPPLDPNATQPPMVLPRAVLDGAAVGAWPSVPGYAIECELGKGGMGVVYRARQTSLNRVVALKMVRAERFTPGELNRFLAEAEAVAAITNRHVVQVYEYGSAGDRPFLALEYLSGGTLAERLKAQGRLAPERAASLVAKLAGAVHAVHDRGIVHRDLKPGNILFDEAGEPKVTDFGLAKRGAGSDLTGTQAVMGTPLYMAPEQARGQTKFVGPAADVYALGVILYECLTGSRPLESDDTLTLLRKVAEEEPVPPGKRAAGVPPDLDLVCLKCLAKEPGERYASAEALAADLNRFLTGEPVSVSRAGVLERTAKWARRKPMLATAYTLAVLVVGLAALTAGATRLWWRAETAAQEAREVRDHLAVEKRQTEEALSQAEESRAQTHQANQQLETEKSQTQQALQRAESARREATQAKDQLDSALRRERQAKEEERRAKERESAARVRLDQILYLRRVSLAYAEWRDNEIAHVEQLLEECPAEFRQWEWYFLRGLFHVNLKTLRGHSAAVTCVAVSPDGRYLASGCEDGIVNVWNAASGQVLHTLKHHTQAVTGVAFSPDGQHLVSAGLDDALVKWEARTGLPVLVLQKGKRSSPSPRRGTGRLVPETPALFPVAWQSAHPTRPPTHPPTVPGRRQGSPPSSRPGGASSRRLPPGSKALTSVFFSPNGASIVTGSSDGVVRIWDARTGEQQQMLPRHASRGIAVAVSPDSKRVASAAGKVVRVSDIEMGEEVFSLKDHSDEVRCLAFSPDGRLLATGGDEEEIKLWDAVTGRRILTLGGPLGGRVASLAFSKDSKRLVSAGEDRVLCVWDVLSGKRERTLRGHTEGVTGVAYWPDGDRIVSSSSDRTLRIWEPHRRQEVLTLAQHRDALNAVAFSSDGQRLASSSEDRTVVLWTAASGQVEHILRGHTAAVNGVAFSPDGQRLATGSEDRTIKLWNARTGEEERTLKGHQGMVQSVSFHPDGVGIASASEDRTIKLWNAHTGKEERTLSGHRDTIYWIAFRPGGKQLASASKDRSVILWDVASGRQVRVLNGHTCSVASVAFSPDGKRLASCGLDYTIRIWDVETGERLLSLEGHKAAVLDVAFSPDGRRLVSAGADRTVKLWDADTGEEALSLKEHTKAINGVAFSPDGQCLATASADRTVKVWRADRTTERAREVRPSSQTSPPPGDADRPEEPALPGG